MNTPSSRKGSDLDVDAVALGMQLRAARGHMSLQSLAASAGVNKDAIVRLERGRGHVATLTVVLVVLKCSLLGMSHEETIAVWLLRVRGIRGIGQREAAKIAGLSQPSIIRIEHGTGSISSLIRLTRAYGLPLRLVWPSAAGQRHPSPPTQGQNHQIFQDHCVERMKLLKLEGWKFAACLCDPPYGLKNIGNWDNRIAFETSTWSAAFDLMLPGAYLLAFASTRTSYLVASALADAGFEIRDSIAWLRQSGLNGSRDVSKSIDAHLGAKREVTGSQPKAGIKSSGRSQRQNLSGKFTTAQFSGDRRDKPATSEAEKWLGWGTNLRGCREDIIVARRPMETESVGANVLLHGCGGLNMEATRFSRKKRYLANVMSDGGFADENWATHYYATKPKGTDRFNHAAAKPQDLLQLLTRLICPAGQTILDPFCGTGAIGEAAICNGFQYVGIELNPGYAEIANSRLNSITMLHSQ